MSVAFLAEHGFTLEQLATICNVQSYSARKYAYGERRLPDRARYMLARDYGEQGRALAGVIDRRRSAWEENHPPVKGGKKRLAIRIEKKSRSVAKSEPTRDAASPADPDWDGVLYSWAEWVDLFGAPSPVIEKSGRVRGFFPTEPCFCEGD